MKKNIRVFFVFFIALIFMSQNYVHAYTNLDYYNNQIVNIGLESLKSTSITLTLNGDYTDTFNGVDYKSGTSLVLNTSTTKILFMDSTYDQLNFKPKDPSNTITINGGKYFGTMNFKTSYDSIAAVYKILPANTLFIEDYLKGVVGYEMSDYFPI